VIGLLALRTGCLEGLCQWKIPMTPSRIETACGLKCRASTKNATPRRLTMYGWFYLLYICWCNTSVSNLYYIYIIINSRCFVYNMQIQLWPSSKTSFTGSRITATTSKAKEKFRMVAILLITLYKSVTIIKAAYFPAPITIHLEPERTSH